MNEYRKMQTVAALIMIAHTVQTVERIAAGRGYMEMTVAEMLKQVVDIGITPVLLVVFVYYFLRKSKEDDRRVNLAYENAQQKIEESNTVIREREDMLIASNEKREEMIRQEAEKRENLIRQEAEKRESVLMLNMDRQLDSMNAITKSLTKMETAFTKMENRLERIEQKLGKEDEDG